MTRLFLSPAQIPYLDIGDYSQCSCLRLLGTHLTKQIAPGRLAKKCPVRVKWRYLLAGTDDCGCVDGYHFPNGLFLIDIFASVFAA